MKTSVLNEVLKAYDPQRGCIKKQFYDEEGNLDLFALECICNCCNCTKDYGENWMKSYIFHDGFKCSKSTYHRFVEMLAQMYNPCFGCIYTVFPGVHIDRDTYPELKNVCKCNQCRLICATPLQRLISKVYNPKEGCIFTQFYNNQYTGNWTKFLKNICLCKECKQF